MKRSILSVIISFLILFGGSLYAQRPGSLLSLENDFSNAYNLFEKEKYTAAQKEFEQLAHRMGEEDSELKTRAEFYEAICGAYLFNEDAEYLLHEFIERNPESRFGKQATWEMALMLYKTKRYRHAVDFFEETNPAILNAEDVAEYYFKKGYSQFATGKYEEAGLSFYEIKDSKNDYTSPALYYYSYIAYKEENFETALQGFRKLEDDKTFKDIVPYYILQILYSQKKYDEIISTGPGLLEKSIPGRKGEIAKFIGDSWCKKGEYENAKEYLELYASNTKNLSREDKYQLGYMYYQTEDYSNASKYFERVGGLKDEMGQNAYYLLADCHIKQGNKKGAGIAFFTAANMDFDEEISEDALFNYAKITYELQFSPFNETVQALQDFIDKYPYSRKIDEAYHYLVLAYFNTKNYAYAYESLKKIQDKNLEIKKAYQRVAFYHGLERFRDLNLEGALDMFDVSLVQGEFDRGITARAMYWKAETMYRMQDFSGAMELYNEFLVYPAAYSTSEYNMAHYNLGYTYFSLEDYAKAARWFRKYEAQIKGSRSGLLADTYNRLGDCAFMDTDYSLSIEYYDKSIAIGSADPDYALFQKSFSHGLQKDHFKKIEGLGKLLDSYSRSNYRDDAHYERGRSYVSVSKEDMALEDFYRILEKYDKSSYYAKALLSIGLVYYNQGKDEKAIEAYKRVVDEFRGSPESRSALTGLRTVYVSMNDVDTYFEYVHSLGTFANVSMSEQDSLTYISGENLYMGGECERAIEVLTSYLEKFADGSFVVNASFYRAECLNRQGRISEALVDYKRVIDRPKNVFTEPSLLVLSELNYNEKDYFDALENYIYLEHVAEDPANRLTALLGQLRCLYVMKDYAGVTSTGKRIIETEELTQELAREVCFRCGKSFEALDVPDKAIESYRKVAVYNKSAEGAESKYRVAKILFDQGKTDEAEKEVQDFIAMNTPHQVWMARIFILSADISLRKDDPFQARYTLQSLIDYYEVEDDGVKAEARKKLEKILEAEKEAEQEAEEKEVPIVEDETESTEIY